MKFAELASIAQAEVATLKRNLPEDIARLTARVAVHLDALPRNSLLAEGFEPDLLGLFDGTPYNDEWSAGQVLPPQIFLYLQNIWDFAGRDLAAYRREVQLTYLHELGHYLGWDEGDLAARGLD